MKLRFRKVFEDYFTELQKDMIWSLVMTERKRHTMFWKNGIN